MLHHLIILWRTLQQNNCFNESISPAIILASLGTVSLVLSTMPGTQYSLTILGSQGKRLSFCYTDSHFTDKEMGPMDTADTQTQA